MTDGVTVHNGITYANHDGVELQGDFYLPKDVKAAPTLVAVHGGGWIAGARSAFQYWGPYLAARGIAVFAISYRLATKTKTFTEAVQDVLAAVQFVRGKASAFGLDPVRIGLLGASSCRAGGAQRQKISRRLSTRSIRRDRHLRESSGWRLWRLRHVRDVVLTPPFRLRQAKVMQQKSGVLEIIAPLGQAGEHLGSTNSHHECRRQVSAGA